MPRPATGSVRVRDRRGRREIYLRFTAYGQRHEILADTADEDRAQAMLDVILEQIRRKQWQPPEAALKNAHSRPPSRRAEPTFGEFVEDVWLAAIEPDLSDRGKTDYEWQVNHLLPTFGPLRLSEITIQKIDEFRNSKIKELDQRHRNGKPTKTLSATSVNKFIARLAQILDLAAEHYPGLLPSNPARGKRRRLKRVAPSRSILEPDQVHVVLDVARAMDIEARADRRHIGRRAVMATMILAGLRIGELCDLRRSDVDMRNRFIYVREKHDTPGEAKTAAGVRKVPISPFLYRELETYLTQARETVWMFPTATGKHRSPDNTRCRIHDNVIERANEKLAADRRPLIPTPFTPHGLRRTFISLLAEAGENPRNVMTWAGHAESDVTFDIYAQTLSTPGSRKLAHELLWKPGEWNAG